ncbi:MAG: putative DNA base hypermodification protein [bacterium]|nr:putative DNA base hypermodification protein [bacterium]
MELPIHLKNLYRHWPLHTAERSKNCTKELPEEICWFVEERMHIWERKTSGLPAPYTDDPVLAKYRFCNVLRELDRQTIEFHTLLNPLRNDFPLWLLNMFYCRMVARPETVRTIGLLSYNQKSNELLYKKFIASSRPRFGTPYVFPISTILKSKTPTRELFITRHLPRIIPKIADEVQTWEKKSVYDAVNMLLPIFGYNHSFLWTEVLIDVAYQFPQHLDLFKQFPIGPGSLPTIKKLDADKYPSFVVAELATLGITVNLTYEHKSIRLSAENWEGIGCEYRKYSNLKRGEGRRRLYRAT